MLPNRTLGNIMLAIISQNAPAQARRRATARRRQGQEKPGELQCARRSLQVSGVDLFRIKGLNAETVLRLLSEVGVDLGPFPTEKHFSSWLTLSPNNKVSGGRVLSSKTKASSNRAATGFRQAAISTQASDSDLGALSPDEGSAWRPKSGDRHST